jgi:hypothetical protein
MAAEHLGVASDHYLFLSRVGVQADAVCRCGWSERFNGGNVDVSPLVAGLMVALWFDEAWDRHAARAGLDPLDSGVRWEALEADLPVVGGLMS